VATYTDGQSRKVAQKRSRDKRQEHPRVTVNIEQIRKDGKLENQLKDGFNRLLLGRQTTCLRTPRKAPFLHTLRFPSPREVKPCKTLAPNAQTNILSINKAPRKDLPIVPALRQSRLQDLQSGRPFQPRAPLFGRPQERVRPSHVRFGREHGDVRRPEAACARALAQQVRGEGLPGVQAVGAYEGAEESALGRSL
jgi:hypothetical protein